MMATRYFPPSPPILSNLHQIPSPFQPSIASQSHMSSHFPPTSPSPSVPRSQYPAVPPTVPPTQPPSGPATSFQWFPSSQLSHSVTIGLRHGQEQGQAQDVSSYLLGPKTAGAARPPGQHRQVAPIAEDAAHGYGAGATAIGGRQESSSTGAGREKKAADKAMEIHKAYQELLDRLHEDFVKERRIWVEERKLYEYRVRDLETKVKTLESRPLIEDKSERFVGEGARSERPEEIAKWEPPPPAPHPLGDGYCLESSVWAPTSGLPHHSHPQSCPQILHQSPHFSKLRPQLTVYSHTPTAHSYSQPPQGHYSYPRPPTRDEISHPHEKNESGNEPRSSSSESPTTPTATKSHSDSYPVASSESQGLPLGPMGEVETDKSKEGEKGNENQKKHNSPIRSPGEMPKPSSPLPADPLATQTPPSDCNPEPILKSPSSKAIDIFSPIPLHKIDPLHISPSPVPATFSPSSPGANREQEGISTWRARSRSPDTASEGGRSDVSEPEVRLVLKRNRNFMGLGGWSELKRVNLPTNEENEEFGFGFGEGVGGKGWKTPLGGFNE